MDMRVEFEFLTPAVQHAEEADVRTEMLRIACDFQKGFCTGAKQEIVEDLLVLQHQRSQVTRKRENHMDVTGRKKFPTTLFQPTFPSTCLTFRAMAISARVVGDGAMSAASAFIEMPAERGGTTPGNSQEHSGRFGGVCSDCNGQLVEMARARRKLQLVLAVLGKRGHGGFVWDSGPGCTILLLGRHSKEAQRPAG